MNNATRKSNAKEIKGTANNWESGKLGLDSDYVVTATAEEELALDNALELKPHCLTKIALPSGN